MLTVMCPNCRHRFPAPGCCNTAPNFDNRPLTASSNVASSSTTTATINFDNLQSLNNLSGGLLLVDASNIANDRNHQQQVTISTQCGIQSGGRLIQSNNAEILLHSSTTTLSTAVPMLEVRSKLSGGGGGCLVQKRFEPSLDYAEDTETGIDAQRGSDQFRPLLISEEQLRNSFEQAAQFHRSHSTTARLEPPPSGCQELPGTRRENTPIINAFTQQAQQQSQQQDTQRNNYPPNSCECRCCCYCRCSCCYTYSRNSSGNVNANGKSGTCTGNELTCCKRHLCQVAAASNGGEQHRHHLDRCCSRSKECDELPSSPRVDTPLTNNCVDSSKYSGDVRIQVNATVHLPSTSSSTLASCTLNITASTSSSTCTTAFNSNSNNNDRNRLRNNFNGGGIISLNGTSNGYGLGNNSNGSNRDETPGTPVSWLTPCPWGFDGGYLPDKDLAKLTEVRRVLQTCGWYHEGLNWQQSENLLKDAPVGRWLMRDSSDSRYTFAISVQTARGPTSVRVFYFMGKFRLDAEPRLALTMPLFDCPIKMLEYYCEYSKRMDEHRQEVWVDYSGLVYSQIYLSEPLVKEVRSLSHLARIVVNKSGVRLEKEKEKLPPIIKNYLKEYPYTL